MTSRTKRVRTITVLGTSVPFSPESHQAINLSADMFEDNSTSVEGYLDTGLSQYSIEAAEAIELLLHSGWTEAELEELSLGDIIGIASGGMQ